MSDADTARKFAAFKLIEGNVAAATRFAREYLQLKGAPAPVVTYPLVEAQAFPALVEHNDAVVASTARLLPGIVQHAAWANPYQPPALRVIALPRCIAIAPNVLLTQQGALLNDNIGYTNAELCSHLPLGFPGIAASAQKIMLAVTHRDTAKVIEPAIYLPATTNYAAWFFGSLPRLAAYAANSQLDSLPILLHGDAPAYQLASLAAMGIAAQRLISYPAHTRLECRELYYCTTAFLHHAPSVTGLRYLRGKMHSTQTGGGRLYLARRHAQDRPLLNEADVVQLFERHGFTAVDPETLTFDEQLRLAANAEVVAGPYGANLANLVFATHARKCLILATKQQPEFARLCSALNMAFWHVVPEAVKLREGRTLSESYGFNAHLEQTEFALNACLAEAT